MFPINKWTGIDLRGGLPKPVPKHGGYGIAAPSLAYSIGRQVIFGTLGERPPRDRLPFL